LCSGKEAWGKTQKQAQTKEAPHGFTIAGCAALQSQSTQLKNQHGVYLKVTDTVCPDVAD